jgi:hypothetical protein
MVATPEFIEQVIATYERAAEAADRDPLRRGNVIVLDADEADEVLVTADLHGHRKNFNLIRRLAALDRHPKRHLVLQEVLHGGPTYANGGCMSHAMLEDVAKLKAQYPDRVHHLLSNHELSELTDFPILKNKRMLNLLFRMGLQEMYGAAAEKVRTAALGFIQNCPLAVQLPNGVFICHSVPERVDTQGFDVGVFDRPYEAMDLREGGAAYRLVWGRDHRPENAKAFARMVKAQVLIHGHEPCPDGFATPNDWQIILDCCNEKASVMLLPVGTPVTQAECVKRIQRLGAS